MSKNKQKPKWKVIKKEVTDIVLANFAKFHLVLPDKMFQQVAKFSKSDDGVAFYVGEIITKGIQILQKITQINYDWKVFQHLKPEVDDENGKNIVAFFLDIYEKLSHSTLPQNKHRKQKKITT